MAYVDSECSVKVNPGLLTLGQPKHRSFSTRRRYCGQLLARPKAGRRLPCNWLLPFASLDVMLEMGIKRKSFRLPKTEDC